MRIEPKENFSKRMRTSAAPPPVLYPWPFAEIRFRRWRIGDRALGTERTRKEIQLALQSVPVTVLHLPGIGADPIEQRLKQPRQSLELLLTVGLDPPSIRMLLTALLRKLPSKVCVETHTGSHSRNRLT